VVGGPPLRDHPDPAGAAEQFKALLTGPMETRSRLGTRPVPDAEPRRVARGAVATFPRAFGPSAGLR
jgi:TetR/AcrR family transcriptional regulator, mexJK operon transcriptional repressor